MKHCISAGNAHASFGVAPAPPTAEELLQPHEQPTAPASTARDPVLSKLSSLGRFLTLPMAPAASQEPTQASSRDAATRQSSVSLVLQHSKLPNPPAYAPILVLFPAALKELA